MDELSTTEAQELARCEAIIAEGKDTFIKVGSALLRIRDGRLYRRTHATFEAYCRKKLGWGRNYVNKQIAAAEVAKSLLPTGNGDLGTTVPTERVARALAALPAAERKPVSDCAVEMAKGGKVTTRHVRRAIQKVRYANRPDPPPCGPNYEVIHGDAEHPPFPDLHVDLTFGSPYYPGARLYLEGGEDPGIDCDTGEWIERMLRITKEALRVTKGLVLWVVGSKTNDWTYEPAAEGLLYRWWAEGYGSCLRSCYWYRSSVAGSGGDQWYAWRIDHVLAFKRPGPLPYADPLVNGHPPKWAPGGEMSYRLSDGTRRTQWGTRVSGDTERDRDGNLVKRIRPSHQVLTKEMVGPDYVPPAIANPGNLISIPVGGGLLGHPLAHENEAPFPEELAAWFIRSHCPPGGLVLDPFGGSGSTVAAALKEGRRGISMDIRQSQCDLARRRLAGSIPNA
jgi:hypothetical protein